MTDPTAVAPRNPCPGGRHHAHPLQTCDEYEQWREQINKEIKTPKGKS